MFIGVLLVCSTLNPMMCDMMHSSAFFETEEDCVMSAVAAQATLPDDVYIAGASCMTVEFLDPDA